MELKDVWIAYCEDRLGAAAETAVPLRLSPDDGMRLLFDWGQLFTARMEALGAVSYDIAFDAEADSALCMLARDDSFAAFDAMSAGAWRVMYERWSWAMVVMMTNKMEDTPVIGGLPSGLADNQRTRAFGLQFLLGGARTIDPRLLEKARRTGSLRIPGSLSLRRQ